MKPETIQSTLQKYLHKYTEDLTKLIPSEGIRAMIDFYHLERVEGLAFDDDSDMLLFQWGIHDWGDGKYFELDITRQFIFDDLSEDENIWQLFLTFRFPPSDDLRRIKSGNKWCESLEELKPFLEFIHTSKAYKKLSNSTAKEIKLGFEMAG